MEHENLNTPQTPSLQQTAVVCSAFSDGQLEDMINYWLDHYTANGDSHYSDTPDWKIREIYWDKIVSRVIEDVNTEMTDEEVDRFCDRLADL
jgi:predicted metallo-beta-lactamase superfamily hydrolase